MGHGHVLFGHVIGAMGHGHVMETMHESWTCTCTWARSLGRIIGGARA